MNKMNEQELELFKAKLEDELDSIVNNKGDIRSFLYLHPNFLTNKMKIILDEFLYSEAYKLLEEEFHPDKPFIVYQDEIITVSMETVEKKTEMLETLIKHFSSKEEYEKCSMIHKLLNTIQNGKRESFSVANGCSD